MKELYNFHLFFLNFKLKKKFKNNKYKKTYKKELIKFILKKNDNKIF